MTSLRIVFLITFLINLNSCANNSHFVYDEEEFDRKSEKFLVGIRDRKVVTICSSTFDPEMSQEKILANNECALFNKRAIYLNSTFSKCPLFNPQAIIFKCINKKDD